MLLDRCFDMAIGRVKVVLEVHHTSIWVLNVYVLGVHTW